MAPRPPLSSYTVGWISALPIELAAAVEMFDEHIQDLAPEPDDPNLYTLGRMDHHHVVLTCLPAGRTGTSSAATVAMQMKSKFKSLRFYLMVGIGGGVPSEDDDVRLGDVVVSQPHMGHGGVVQYDFGKETPDGFMRTGFLNAPPTVLLHAVSRLQANHFGGRNKLPTYMSRYAHLPEFDRGKAGPDLLFESTYDHVKGGGRTCQRCDQTKLVEREPREPEGIRVHYGTIASGNQVMKYGKSRERLKREMEDVLCVEMEAAGVVNNIRCLVIRGICDYADSHKNDKWHACAAGAAAACARELLSVIPAPEIAATDTIEGALGVHGWANPSQHTLSSISTISLEDTSKPSTPPPLPTSSKPSNTDSPKPSSNYNTLNGKIWLEGYRSDGRLLLTQYLEEWETLEAYSLRVNSLSFSSPRIECEPGPVFHESLWKNNKLRKVQPGSVPWPPMAIRVAELTLNLPSQVFDLTLEKTRTFAALDPKLFTPDSGHPWRGIWSAGTKFVLFHQPTERYLEGILLTGDSEMRRGSRLLVVEDLFARLEGNARPEPSVNAWFNVRQQPGMGETSVPVILTLTNEDRITLTLDFLGNPETVFWRVWPVKNVEQRRILPR